MSTVYIECPSRPTKTLFDLIIDFGAEPGLGLPKEPAPGAGDLARRYYERDLTRHERLVAAQKSKIIEPSAAPFFICGSVEPEPFCACGHTAELLCDHPTWRGKTCDAKLCWCCGKHVGEDRDLCQIHFAEFVTRTGAWPPPMRSR